ncbi:adenosylmethionine--8-amino-7-oxononanoate transaminase [Desmospora profundinema]|uniref:Adenosylmethionine-8-amino-7-oxononanoate aminotransferase n=1 Tax=Desmospora profundinema TaxID=1571184 RepID=A0ABU1IJ37_9BACL|nr:adenosylmethionine--8-amino-7-oxononanoate transaminase [Desmospora profundinema]MDR6224773.1 adenosylmethionine-8-amino-7-oxononanoate transaminase [Desmospora profundinema]
MFLQSDDTETLWEKNRQYLWNPFTQMKTYLDDEPLIIQRGEGVRLVDIHGNSYYDGYASVWLNVHGHNHPRLNEAIREQLDQIAHSTLLGAANVPAILLAERLVSITPPSLRKVFYSDSGAEAVEIALKMAFLYWKRKGRPEKNTFLCMGNAYHGDTVGAVSVGGMDLFHAAYDKLLFPTLRTPYPHPYRFDGTEQECLDSCLEKLRRHLDESGDTIAALILEPMMQGAAGMIRMPAGFLKKTEELCRQHDVLLIADEVATGFGRTGAMFACDHEGVQPDLMALGKKLTGGYLPVAATLTSDAIYEAFYGDYEEMKTFFHGHSYTGNQLGCAVALANLDLYEETDLLSHVDRLSRAILSEWEPMRQRRHVGDIRQLGLMIGIELVKDRKTRESFAWADAVGVKVCRRARDLGLLTRPLGNVITLMPPLAVSQEDLTAMIAILDQAIREVTE